MATLIQRLTALVQTLGADHKSTQQKIGSLPALTTTAKDSLVAAINEVSAAAAPGGRELLTAPRTYYVRTDGNDSNAGLADSAAGAFKTIGRAVNAVAALDCGAHQVTINVGPGQFSESVTLPAVRGVLPPLLTGAGASTVLDVTNFMWPAITLTGQVRWRVSSLALTRFGTGVYADYGAVVHLSQITYLAPALTSAWHLNAARGAVIHVTGSNTISVGGSAHLSAESNGVIDLRSASCVLTGSPAFSVGFASAISGGLVLARGATFSGGATGARYRATFGGGIAVEGAGTALLPGNTAGVVNTSGWYA